MKSIFVQKLNNYLLFSTFLISTIYGAFIPALSQQKTCILTDLGKKECGRLIQPNSSPVISSQSPVILDFESGDSISVKLERCYRNLNKVQCKFKIDRVDRMSHIPILSFVGNDFSTDFSQATDNQGEDYIPSQITIGNKSERTSINVEFNQGRTISPVLTFLIPQRVSVIKKLSFGTKYLPFFGEFKVANFLNINISR